MVFICFPSISYSTYKLELILNIFRHNKSHHLRSYPEKVPLNIYEILQKATPVVLLESIQSGNEVGEHSLNEVGEERRPLASPRLVMRMRGRGPLQPQRST